MHPFPIYRKYSGQNTWIEILSENEWNELRILGKFYNLTNYKVQLFTDRHQIADMIDNFEGRWEEINEELYSKKLNECKSEKTVKENLF